MILKDQTKSRCCIAHRLSFAITKMVEVDGINRRPPACKAGALPAELNPQLDYDWWVWLARTNDPRVINTVL